jgi:hypothetical protein
MAAPGQARWLGLLRQRRATVIVDARLGAQLRSSAARGSFSQQPVEL